MKLDGHVQRCDCGRLQGATTMASRAAETTLICDTKARKSSSDWTMVLQSLGSNGRTGSGQTARNNAQGAHRWQAWSAQKGKNVSRRQDAKELLVGINIAGRETGVFILPYDTEW